MRGRKPKPTFLKLAAGNPGRRRLNHAEPTFSALPPPPEHLGDEARAEWERLGTELVTARLLTAADMAGLAMYCLAWGRWVETERMLAKTTPLLKSAEGGYYLNPLLSVANQAAAQMVKLLAEFGLTPSSRTRLKAPEKKPDAGGGKAKYFAG